MQKLGLNELRERFLKFYEGKGHLRLPSFSLVPQNDPSILLINAGMTPLKPYFTGQQVPPCLRVTTCQKCIRTPDIENVGITARHGTFFEMLGNFSFGEYFKKEAIPWAWEFCTQDMKFPADRLWVSIYEEDGEAYDIWRNDVGLPPERIVRMGKKDNFWEHGTGPCGPCSEIYFDRGADKGCGKPDCAVGCDCDRYIEFYNLVFTQYNRHGDGTYTLLEKKNIDTGLGLERLACIVQGVDSLFETDTIRNILDYICEIAGVKYGSAFKSDVSIRVITDHIRGSTMIVSDGVLPSNEGRGYVLRRLIRRAARHGRLLGINKPFLYKVAKVVIEESKAAYPELAEKESFITKVIRIEEEKFEATVDQGMNILNGFIEDVKGRGQKAISGDMVFKLHDTYGFPLDITREIAAENGLSIDEEGFRKEMGEQKNKAREALKGKVSSAWGADVYAALDKDLKTEFLGYETLESDSEVEYILRDGGVVENAQEGDEVTVVLNRTPFYAESGGQTGDAGILEGAEGTVRVDDCKKTADGKYLHMGVVEKGLIEAKTGVKARVDSRRRMAIARNHTATHLLQKALRNVIGTHVTQAGSLVEPDRLRFDFTHFTPVTGEELKRVEQEINLQILEDLPVDVKVMPIDEARKLGAMALFGEKYGDMVRLVKIGDYSLELCGGTHLASTSRAGLIKILGESGIASGVRRIEALTGEAAIEYLNEREQLLEEIASALKTTPQDSLRKIEGLTSEIRSAQKEIEQLRQKLVGGEVKDIAKNVAKIKGANLLTYHFDNLDMDSLRNTSDMLRNKLGSGIVVLASSYGGKANFVVSATDDMVRRGIHSGNIIREVAKVAGGGGGGRPDMAQAGAKDISKIDEALRYSHNVIERQLTTDTGNG